MSNAKPGILVVEDETVVAMDLESDLVQLGYEVVGIADNGSDALRLVNSMHPDLVLMDIKLSGAKDGIETAREIRETANVPVVFVTANSNETTLRRVKDIELFGYLTKPYRTSDLNAAVTLALQQHSITRALFAEKTWLNTLLSSLSDGVVATDESGLVRYVSPVAEAITGWLSAAAIGKPIEDVYQLAMNNGQPASESQLRRVLRTRRSAPRQEFLLVSKAGKCIFVEDAARPILDKSGALIGAVSLFLDITERRLAEQQRETLRREIERSNEDLSRFSYSLAHDLTGPSSSIHAIGKLLLKGEQGELNGGQQHLVDMMTRTAEGMQRLVTSMLQFAQVGRGIVDRQQIASAEMIEAVRVRLAAAMQDTGTTIHYGKLPVIEADRTQMEQVFQNLIANAIQYRMPENPPLISILAETTDTEWRFSVQDNGQGIPSESLERIFEPLKRLHGKDVPGTGLGLALCRRIIERHGGRIWAESPGAGGGTTLQIVLPVPRPTV